MVASLRANTASANTAVDLAIDLAAKSHHLRDRLKASPAPILVAVAGDSGSGKTTYSEGIYNLLGPDWVSTICTDGYHKEDRAQRQKSGRLPLDPEANRLDLLAEHLADLKQGLAIELPIYNHSSGCFDPPVKFVPTPIVIVEGLHCLYPEFLPYIDFGLYIDPDQAVKWEWKWERDLKRRGHKAEALEAEMLARAAAYKRWIDFQRVNASVVVKTSHSEVAKLARHRFTGSLPDPAYRVELVVEQSAAPLAPLPIRLDLGAMLAAERPPLSLAVVPCSYWGRAAVTVLLDGMLFPQAIAELERQIVAFSGIPLPPSPEDPETGAVSAVGFAQLLIAWRFLEQLNYLLA